MTQSKSKRKRNGKSKPPNEQFRRASASHGFPPVQSSNLFATFASTEEDDELNSHLSERFAGASFTNHRSVPNDGVPSSRPSRVTSDTQDYYNLAKKSVNGGAWLQKSEIPHPSEIFCDQRGFTCNASDDLIGIEETIRPHKIEGEYDNNEDYLRTKYELLREDALRPLREAVNEVRADPFRDEAEYQNQSIGIYDPVYITAVVCSFRGLATRVAFSLSRVKKHIRWEQSKRLITGTLVALSPVDDAFQTHCVLAIVAARPLAALDQNPPQIDLFFARPEDQELDPMTKWIMVECRSSFFEASRHILTALQHMMRESFPLSEHLVKVQKQVEPPAYIQHNPYLDLRSLVSVEESGDFEHVNVLDEWPSGSSHSLDASQSRALKRMLTRKLAIIQGPPGTGKTHVSVRALQILRDNLRRGDAPIIVTAQTNHAVDQILRHTMEFEPNFIRLGGRSKDKDIKKRTLYEVRSEMPQQKQPGSLKTQATTALRKLGNTCKILLLPMEANKSPLDHRVLLKQGLITEDQAASLVADSESSMGISITDNPEIVMEQWLGRCLTACTHPIQPDDYGIGFEEEDHEVEQLQEAEAEAIQDEDDIEALPGEVILLSDNYRGKGAALTDEEIQKILDKTADLTVIPNNQRGAIYNFFLKEVKKSLVKQARKIAKEYEATVLSRKIGRWNEDARLLSEARIIGCTTTGLSKYRALISAIRPRVVLVEEAAETQESPVTAACFPSLEHLILVGDHLQLRPHTQVHAFEDKPYFLNLSLFERLVNNEVEFDTLTRQRRMIPEIRRLLTPIYGTTVEDHKSVEDPQNRPPVEGMGGVNSFFFCHEWQEKRDTNMSALNEPEAEMVVKFFDYLVLNSIDPSCITVLTFYNGQRKFIMKQMRNHSNLRSHPGIKVATVDSYQGEENDIVLLSLVRSNRKRAIGFLSSDNRACVALSRAKRGFYIFGNAELLACESGTWASVVDIMHSNKTEVKVTQGQLRRLGYNLPTQCTRHGRKLWIEQPEDFNCIKGGCDLFCDDTLSCGHKCSSRCHPFDHVHVKCTRKCSRRIESCGHPCTENCGETCKCQICEHRIKGVKSELKQIPRDSTLLQSQVLRPYGTSSVNRFHMGPQSGSLPKHSHNLKKMNEWEMYSNGGAQTDDARLLKKHDAEGQVLDNDCTYTPPLDTPSKPNKLIEVSPEKAPRSKNTNLLIDLDMDVDDQPARHSHHAKPLSYADAASSEAQREEEGFVNLLD